MSDAKQEQKWQGLMVRTQSGDQQAYQELLTDLYPVVRNFVASKVGGVVLAEDITQECLISLHKALHTYDSDRAFKPWLFTIVRYKLIDVMRKKQKQWRREVIDDQRVATFSDSASNSIIEGVEELVQESLQALPEEMKRAVVATKIEGLSTQEAADKENISTVALRSRVSRAYKIMRKKLENEIGR